MACTNYTISGIAKGCKDSLGGIVKVWISSDYDDVLAGVKVEENVLDLDASKITKFKVFNFFKNTGSITSNLQVSDSAGSSWQTDLVLVFMKQETSKRLQIMGLAMGQTCIVVKDANGKYWFLGKDNPVEASAGVAQSGTAATDLNGYNITLSDNSKELPFEITNPTTIGALEAINVA